MLKIRLMRIGKKKKPFYRVVVAPSNAPRSGRFVEIVGHYNPLTDPAQVNFNEERVLYWLRTGAQPTDTVQLLLERAGIWQQFQSQKESKAAQ
ncbi:MAG: 30S ribosomal protein S16 [Fimbriimonadales bacterium]|jgi:small subunit ribosomal protein S16|nr:30S ribosomal protein S16 [Armatimonadota bacterium]MCX7687697.1 30S ribosomal protein S16 [Fimbriimonadales bacterium]CUU10490.1 SSU ribosomal protein S16P [Armatimonadetes bacterium GBS]CUU33729.1 SSU ribosomal protein S16P [Armatimonadetes bacterium GXS]CUU35740.1 SSU ribosomal protein S16P [Armatimonadetes bacterium DC]GBC91059.1 30S ribosomal protein S16 [bacterium HR14]